MESVVVAGVVPAPESVENLRVRGGDGQVRLTWNPVDTTNMMIDNQAVSHYSYDYYPTDDEVDIIIVNRQVVGPGRGLAMIEDLTNGVGYTFNVYLHAGAIW